MGKIIYDERAGIGYLSGSHATFKFMSEHQPINRKDPAAPGANPTEASLDDPDTAGTKWVKWGDNNDFPQKVIKEVYKVSAAPAALGFKIKAHYGTGLIMFKIDYDENGKEIIKPQKPSEHPEAKAFFKNSRIKRYLHEQVTDLVWFYNTFPEMIVSRDWSKITSVRSLEATFCRWAEMDEHEKRIKILGYSAMWPEEKDITEIAVINPWWTIEQTRDYLKKERIYKFVYPTYIPTPGKSFYQEAYWNAARKSGWFDIANAVPTTKKAMMKNITSIKWHVEIPIDYWDKLFPSVEFDKKAKKAGIEEKLKEMDDFLSGSTNAGKTFYSHFAVDPISKQPMPGWKLTQLKSDNGGEHLEDGQAANSEIFFAMNVDPTLIGHGVPGGKLGAGSGSDKREAFNIYNALLATDRDITLEPLEFIRDFNGWDEDLMFGFGNITLKTLDKNPTGSEKTVQT